MNLQNEVFISDENYLIESDLKQQQTYISKIGFATSLWDFSTLSNNKYPIIKSSSLPEQEGINLPIDSEHIVGNTKNTENFIETQSIENQEELEQIFEYSGKEIETYSTYSAITAEDGSIVTRNVKLYVKDNNLYAIPSALNANNETEVVKQSTSTMICTFTGMGLFFISLFITVKFINNINIVMLIQIIILIITNIILWLLLSTVGVKEFRKLNY